MENENNPFVLRVIVGLIGVVTISVLITFGILGYTQVTGGTDKEQYDSKRVSTQIEPYETWKLVSPVNVSVYDSATRQYRTVKMEIALGFNQEMRRTIQMELKQRRHQIQDLVLHTIRQKSFEEIEATRSLKDEITNEINKSLTRGGRIKTVYFTKFVVE
ncbi:MAG: flagellar basal body-associated protein FliL [bacterium]